MNRRSLNILLIAEAPPVIQLLEEALRELDDVLYYRPWLSPSTLLFASHIEEALDLLQSPAVDVILLHTRLPGIDLPDAFEALSNTAPSVPVVLIGEADSERMAFDLFRQGAQDLLLTMELDPVPMARVLRAAICRHRLLSGLRSLALVDELTGLYTERGFFHLAARHVHLARQLRAPVGLFLVEPQPADRSGHSRRQEDDLDLIRTAEFLHGCAEPFDLLARLCPRRFAWLLLLAGPSSGDDVRSRFHAARQLLAARRATHDAPGLRTGCALESKPEDFCLDRLLQEAETALRDRCRVASTGGELLLPSVRK